jgi:hypothetical protein
MIYRSQSQLVHDKHVFRNSVPRKEGKDALLDGQIKCVGKEYGKGEKADKDTKGTKRMKSKGMK